MATLSIRNLPDDVHRKLRVRAARHGRSMEAEARAILAEAADTDGEPALSVAELQAIMRTMYDGKLPTGVVDELITERRREAAREAAEE